MYVHLLVSEESAEKIFALARKRRTKGAELGNNLWDHFTQYSQVYVQALDCTMEMERRSVDPQLFSLHFRQYLAEVPPELAKMKIGIVGVELHRFHSAPTAAVAGFYRCSTWTEEDITATVERVFPTQHEYGKKPEPLYAQNIEVKGPTLKSVLDFNSALSQGGTNEYLMEPWEALPEGVVAGPVES